MPKTCLTDQHREGALSLAAIAFDHIADRDGVAVAFDLLSATAEMSPLLDREDIADIRDVYLSADRDRDADS